MKTEFMSCFQCFLWETNVLRFLPVYGTVRLVFQSTQDVVLCPSVRLFPAVLIRLRRQCLRIETLPCHCITALEKEMKF